MHSMIPWGWRVPIWKINFCSRVKQLSDTYFYAKVYKDLTLIDQNIISNFYRQMNGIAISTKMDQAMPIFLEVSSNIFFSQYHDPKPELYGCYIDNCIGATSSTRGELTQCKTAVNSFHTNFKVTYSSELSDK